MSRRKKVDSWNSVELETPQEVKAALPDVERPHGGSRRYKDSRNWCRGKIGGQRHVGVITISLASSLRSSYPDCYWADWSMDGRRLYYYCSHQLICANERCRKVLKRRLGVDECPDRDRAPTIDREWIRRQSSQY